jgi:Immunoglobulin-like domain of bacterial spore germination
VRLGLLVVVALLAAGCGGNGDGGDPETGGTAAVVYFLRDGKVWPVFQEAGDAEGGIAEALAAGPTGDASELRLETEVPEGVSLVQSGSVATVESDETLSDGARAQLVYTLTRDEGVDSVEIDGTSYTRDDFEEQTPSVLVESPLAYGEVSSPLAAEGTANTFEATFSFEILDEGGELLAGDFATATSGTGTRGTFMFEQPFVVDEEQDGTLRVFELSAEDGSRMNEVDIPVRLLP